jgi:hypothetical protein
MLPAMGDGRMKTLMCGVALVAIMAAAGAAAEPRAELASPGMTQFSYSLVPMPPLPRRHQNHCGYVNGHYVCADHCGADYQVYYCPTSATGCCHVGLGYCDAAGRLRCAPAWYEFPFTP